MRAWDHELPLLTALIGGTIVLIAATTAVFTNEAYNRLDRELT